MTIEIGPVIEVVVFTLAMAVLGALLAGDALRTWVPALTRPWFQIPTPLFVGVGVLGYLFDVVILYRLLTVVHTADARIVCLAAMAVVMLYGELWNAALFRLRSPFAGFLLVLAFLAPLVVLEVALVVFEPASAVLIGIYLVWVIAYDVPWTYRLWKLNPDPREVGA
jgi:tryptophan-rich sensory protein